MADTRTHVERINGPRFAAQETPMTPEQFAELKQLLIDLLTPGYQLSSLMLDQYKRDRAMSDGPSDPPPPCPPAPPTEPPAPDSV